MELIYMLMDLNMKGNGKMIYNMVMELNHGLMDRNIQEHITKEKNKEKENINGLMVLIMMENGMIIKLLGMEHIIGQMVEDMSEIG